MVRYKSTSSRSKMRLTAAYFAYYAEVVDGMLNLSGGFWASTTVAADATSFRADVAMLTDVGPEDVGRQFGLTIIAEGPTGHRRTAFDSQFTLESRTLFMVLPSLTLPIQPGGGFHTYYFRLDGQHERLAVRLAVRQALG